jgi:hypothetical protein
MESGKNWQGSETIVEDNSLLVTRTGDTNLFVLNDSGREIWQAWRLGYDRKEIARLLADIYEADKDQLLEDVDQAICEWQTKGLIADQDNSAGLHEHKPIVENLKSTARLPVSEWYSRRSYRLYDFNFDLYFETQGLDAVVHPVFSHLEIQSSRKPDAHFELLNGDSGLVLQNRSIVKTEIPTTQALAMVTFTEVALAAYQGRDNLMVFHAAAVASGDACVVLPGAGGSGKSTLTTALLDRGFNYLSDDVVPIDRKSQKAVPMPFSLNLKSGSRKVLKNILARWPQQPTEYSWDGRRVWYLNPIHDQHIATNKLYQVRLLVFPEWGMNNQTILTPLTTIQKIERLIAGNSLLGNSVGSQLTEELINWLKYIPAYSLQYASLKQAVTTVEDLLMHK